jgi:hypothetical protein
LVVTAIAAIYSGDAISYCRQKITSIPHAIANRAYHEHKIIADFASGAK